MNEKLMRVDWYPEIPIDAPEFGYFIAVRQIAISEGFRCGIANEVGVFRLEMDYPAAKAKFLCLAVSLEEGSRICAALNLADASELPHPQGVGFSRSQQIDFLVTLRRRPKPEE